MLFRVSGSSFKQVMSDVAGSSAKKTVNFTFRKGTLRIQAANIVIVEEYIPIIEQDADYESFSTTLNNTIELINPDEVLNIAVNGDTMTLMQGLFNYSVIREYAEAVEYSLDQNLNWVPLNLNQLNEVCKDVRAIELVTKTLGTESFSIAVTSNTCYIDGQCICYQAPLNLPDCTISNKVLKELVRLCKGSSKAALDKGVLSISSGDKRILATVELTDLQHVKVLQQLIQGMKLLVQQFDISRYSSIFDVFLKVYSNSLASLTIGKDGMTIYMDNGEARVVAGMLVESLCSIQLSIQEAVCMTRIMGSVSSIEVYGGTNKICLVQKNNNKRLTLAGTTY